MPRKRARVSDANEPEPEPEPELEPKRRVTRSSTRVSQAQGKSHGSPSTGRADIEKKGKGKEGRSKAEAKGSGKRRSADANAASTKGKRKGRPNTKPNSVSEDASGSPPQSPESAISSKKTTTTTTTFTISSPDIAKPIQCIKYTPLNPNHSTAPSPSTSPSSSRVPTLIFTHGAGGTLSAPSVQNFLVGYGGSRPVLAFQGSMNLASRVKGFGACITWQAEKEGGKGGGKECEDGKGKEDGKGGEHELLLGGRSMGSRAAVLASTQILHDPSTHPPTMKLILISYPLLGPKGEDDLRDAILIDLPAKVSVLFIIGERDKMCPLDLLEEARGKMRAESRVVVVEGMDHGMCGGGKERERVVGEMTGRVAARWVEGVLDEGVSRIGGEGDEW